MLGGLKLQRDGGGLAGADDVVGNADADLELITGGDDDRGIGAKHEVAAYGGLLLQHADGIGRHGDSHHAQGAVKRVGDLIDDLALFGARVDDA